MTGLVERLKSSAKAFRENTVYDSEGDPIRLLVQADECDEAADRITALEAENERLREAAGGVEPPPNKPCGATQQSDEMYCARCQLRWDVNDPEPPSCRA